MKPVENKIDLWQYCYGIGVLVVEVLQYIGSETPIVKS